MSEKYDMILRTHPGPFRAVWRGDKTAELRKDDRGFQVNDRIQLIEWDPSTGSVFYPFRAIILRVTHILRVRDWTQCADPMVVLSFKVIRRKVGGKEAKEK